MQSTTEINSNSPSTVVIPNSSNTCYKDLWSLISKGDVEGSIKLIDQLTDVNVLDDRGFSPLHTAGSFGNIEIVEYLLSKKADINLCCKGNGTPLYHTFNGIGSISSIYSIYKLLSDKRASSL